MKSKNNNNKKLNKPIDKVIKNLDNKNKPDNKKLNNKKKSDKKKLINNKKKSDKKKSDKKKSDKKKSDKKKSDNKQSDKKRSINEVYKKYKIILGGYDNSTLQLFINEKKSNNFPYITNKDTAPAINSMLNEIINDNIIMLYNKYKTINKSDINSYINLVNEINNIKNNISNTLQTKQTYNFTINSVIKYITDKDFEKIIKMINLHIDNINKSVNKQLFINTNGNLISINFAYVKYCIDLIYMFQYYLLELLIYKNNNNERIQKILLQNNYQYNGQYDKDFNINYNRFLTGLVRIGVLPLYIIAQIAAFIGSVFSSKTQPMYMDDTHNFFSKNTNVNKNNLLLNLQNNQKNRLIK